MDLAHIPLFPLPEVQLFPGAKLPLHVFEPRYRMMLADCMNADRTLAIVMLKAETDTEGLPKIHRLGGLGRIVAHEAHGDGRSNILLEGIGRVLLEELPFTPPYRIASATLLQIPDAPVESSARIAMQSIAARFVAAIHKRNQNFAFRTPENASVALEADIIAQHLVLDADERQEILETLDIALRVRRVTTALATQLLAPRSRTGEPSEGMLH